MSINHDYKLSRRGFCLCCVGAATFAATGGWLTPAEAFVAAGNLVNFIREDAAKAPVTTTKLRGGVSAMMGSGGNVGVITGQDGKVLVDAGIAVTRPRIEKALMEIGPEPIAHLINSHWHFDHSGGNEWLNEDGATIMAHPNTLKHLTVATRVEDWKFDFPPLRKSGLPTMLMEGDEQTLKLNGQTIALKYYGPAHTDSDISIFFQEANVIHVADTFWNGIYPFIDYSTGGSIDGQIKAAEANVQAVDDKTIVIPGHGAIGGKTHLIAFRDMLVGIRDNVAKLKKDGRTSEEAVAAKPTTKWDSLFGQYIISPDLFTRLVYEGV